MLPRSLVAALVVVATLTITIPGHPALAAPARPGDRASAVADGYRPPVPGRVLHPFDPPPEPWRPGRRGVILDAGLGEPVRAAGAGRVAFAGPVAGKVWVTVDHADGVATTYGPLADLRVAAGDTVAAGDVVGVVALGASGLGGLHWGARRDGAYIDPLSLLGSWRATLVGGPDERFTGAPQLPRYQPWRGRRDDLGLLEPTRIARGPGWVFAPNGSQVVALPGVNSATGYVPFDVTHLGYRAADVTVFGYRGPGADGRARPHRPEDTWEGVESASEELEAFLRAHWRDHPGEPVDLVGYSLGGVVALHYLLTRHDPSDPGLPPIGHVVTLASPLEGADVANAYPYAVGRWLRPVWDPFARHVLDQPGTREPTLTDLQVGSPLLRKLAEAWAAARDDPRRSPLAAGTQVLTVGGSRDLVVVEHRSDLPASDHVVVPGGHERMRHTEAVRLVTRAFLADQPVPGGRGGTGHRLSYAVSLLEAGAAEYVSRYTDPVAFLERRLKRARHLPGPLPPHERGPR